MFGFVGSNGAGRKTAIRIVLGVLEPDRGEVRWRAGGWMSRPAGASATCPRTTVKRFFAGSLGFAALRRILGHLGKQV